MPGMPSLPPGGIMPIIGAPPAMGRDPGGIAGIPGDPPAGDPPALPAFTEPNMNCCGAPPPPAEA